MPINQVLLLGRCVSNPKPCNTKSDSELTFTLLTGGKYYNPICEMDDRVHHKIVVPNGLAKRSEDFIKKGNLLYIVGSLRYNTFPGLTDPYGEPFYIPIVIAESIRQCDFEDPSIRCRGEDRYGYRHDPKIRF